MGKTRRKKCINNNHEFEYNEEVEGGKGWNINNGNDEQIKASYFKKILLNRYLYIIYLPMYYYTLIIVI